MEPFATPSDVAARWSGYRDSDEDIAATLCEDASSILRAEFPDIDDRIANGSLDRARATQVVAGMVKRALIAPMDGVDSQSETVGPYSYSQKYANAMQNIFLVAPDRLLILGYRAKGMSMRFGNTTNQQGQVYQQHVDSW